MSSVRSEVVRLRTYARPVEGENRLETWAETVARVKMHQRWLWERAADRPLHPPEEAELDELEGLMLARKVLPAGRTLWLGGTPLSQRREVSQFNCSFGNTETVHDVVDQFWLLLNGCGVGFTPTIGTLNGFANPIEDIQVVRSTRTAKGGKETNEESFDGETWTIKVGDSGEAWAKAVGKLLAGKFPAQRLVLDLSEIRPAGERLGSYGWISSGDEVLAEGLVAIAQILSRRAGQLLSKLDILDVMNWCGYLQTGRRGAEIALVRHGEAEWMEFARAKKDYWSNGNPQRSQSNNSLVFYDRPDKKAIRQVLDMMVESGGSEPGLINGAAARRRAPWFSGVNPCSEILLGNRSFCNLVEVDLAKFQPASSELFRAIYLVARANYRQTCVNLDDGILQRAWHENNEFLRLCGVGLTGIARVIDRMTPYDFRILRNYAVLGAYSMADELQMPRPKNVTTIKPSGTVSKLMDTTEGVHKPLSRFILNNIVFNRHDPMLEGLEAAGYRVNNHPIDAAARLVTFPVRWDGVSFDRVNGLEVNLESAVTQLERYRMLMDNYVDHNCSITISYSVDELDDIIDWLDRHWDSYVGVSFLLRADPTKTAKDLGYAYLPQEAVDEKTWNEYSNTLRPVNLDAEFSTETVDAEDGCATGACPVR